MEGAKRSSSRIGLELRLARVFFCWLPVRPFGTNSVRDLSLLGQGMLLSLVVLWSLVGPLLFLARLGFESRVSASVA